MLRTRPASRAGAECAPRLRRPQLGHEEAGQRLERGVHLIPGRHQARLLPPASGPRIFALCSASSVRAIASRFASSAVVGSCGAAAGSAGASSAAARPFSERSSCRKLRNARISATSAGDHGGSCFTGQRGSFRQRETVPLPTPSNVATAVAVPTLSATGRFFCFFAAWVMAQDREFTWRMKHHHARAATFPLHCGEASGST